MPTGVAANGVGLILAEALGRGSLNHLQPGSGCGDKEQTGTGRSEGGRDACPRAIGWSALSWTGIAVLATVPAFQYRSG
jgi:hypothetical protein